MATKRDAEKVARKFGGWIDGGYVGDGRYDYLVEAPHGWAWGGDVHGFVVQHGDFHGPASEAWQEAIDRMNDEKPVPCLATCEICWPAQQHVRPS